MTRWVTGSAHGSASRSWNHRRRQPGAVHQQRPAVDRSVAPCSGQAPQDTEQASARRAASRMSSSAVSSSSSVALCRPPAATSSRQPARRRAGSGSAARARSASRSWWYRSPAATASYRARAGVIHGPRVAPFRELSMASFIGCPLGPGGFHGVRNRPFGCTAGVAARSRSPRAAVDVPWHDSGPSRCRRIASSVRLWTTRSSSTATWTRCPAPGVHDRLEECPRPDFSCGPRGGVPPS